MLRFALLLVIALVHAQTDFNATASVRISELMSNVLTPGFTYVELINTASVSIDLAGWSIFVDVPLAPITYNFSGVIQPGGFHVTPPNALHLPATGLTAQLRYRGVVVQNVTVASSVVQYSYARFEEPATRREHYAQSISTYNFTNRYPVIGPFVISEILFNPPPGKHEYLKVKNVASTWQRFRSRSSPEPWLLYIGTRAAYDRRVPHNTQNHAFIFPMDVYLGPGEEAYVVPIPPREFRRLYQIDPKIQVFGPVRRAFSDIGNKTDLLQLAVQSVNPVLVDEVYFRTKSPWPENAISIHRISEASYGDNPFNWRFPNVTFPCTTAADCPVIDNCTVAACLKDTQHCAFYTKACHPNFATCFPENTCDRTVNPEVPAAYNCSLPHPTKCFPIDNPPATPTEARPAFAAIQTNVAPLGHATMVPDMGNTSRLGIDGNYRDGFKADNSLAESVRNATNPTYTITLNRDYDVHELRTIRIWNRFDGETVRYNYPFNVKLMDGTGKVFYEQNFTKVPTWNNNNTFWYPRINSIYMGVNSTGNFALRTIVITAPGAGRNLSLAEVQVMAVVPLNCTMSDWLEWSPCSNGMKTRERIIYHLAANGGVDCPNDLRELVPCDNASSTTAGSTGASTGATTGSTTGSPNSTQGNSTNSPAPGSVPAPIHHTPGAVTPKFSVATFKCKIRSDSGNCTAITIVATAYRTEIVRKLSTSFGLFSPSRIQVEIKTDKCHFTASHNKRDVQESTIPVSVGVSDGSVPGEPPTTDIIAKIEKILPDVTALVANHTGEVVPGSQSDFVSPNPAAPAPSTGLPVYAWVLIALAILVFIIVLIACAINHRKRRGEEKV